ncbi:MAG: hypothetical protein ABSF48_28665 [Thermodesulfobacteriota bacterium]
MKPFHRLCNTKVSAILPSLIGILLFTAMELPAAASPVTWNLTGVTFPHGLTATGYFVVANDGTLSDYSITVPDYRISSPPYPNFTFASTSPNSSYTYDDSGHSLIFYSDITPPSAPPGGIYKSVLQLQWDGGSLASFVASKLPLMLPARAPINNYELTTLPGSYYVQEYFISVSPWDGWAVWSPVTAGELVASQELVSIDIEPDRINLKSKGKIEVAILSTKDFDALSQIDPVSLTFGRTGDEQSLAFCHGAENIHEDGNDRGVHWWKDKDELQDLLCHFYTHDAGFQCGDTEGILKGKTKDGTPIEGSHSVYIVPCK